MFETLKKEWAARIVTGIFIALTIWWILLRVTTPEGGSFQNQLFAAVYGVVALAGGLFGIFISKKWGFLKSVLGKAILMLSVSLLFQEFGQLSYSYYIYYKKIDVPYPSIGDIGYFGSIFFYIAGVWLLANTAGVKVGLKSIKSKLIAVIIPLVALVIGYMLFLQGYTFDFSNPLKIFLDFGYPFGEAIYISLAILAYLLSKGVLGGIMKSKVLFILLALCVQFASDYTFLFQSSKGIWYAGGINDFMYMTAYFLMTIGILQFDTVYKKLRGK